MGGRRRVRGHAAGGYVAQALGATVVAGLSRWSVGKRVGHAHGAARRPATQCEVSGLCLSGRRGTVGNAAADRKNSSSGRRECDRKNALSRRNGQLAAVKLTWRGARSVPRTRGRDTVPSAFFAVPAAIVTETPGRFGLLTTVVAPGLIVTAWAVSMGGIVRLDDSWVVTLAIRSTGTTRIAYPCEKPSTFSCWRPDTDSPVSVNTPCALVTVLWPVAFSVTVTLASGVLPPSTTRPDTPVTPPGGAPVTLIVIVSEEDAAPSEATNVRVTAPTCVASGVKTNCPVSEWNDACAGNGSGVMANVTKSLFGSVAVTVKSKVVPSATVRLPMGVRAGGLLSTVNGCGLVAVPCGVMTVIGPVVANCGTVVVIAVGVTVEMMAEVPLNLTALFDGVVASKFVPLIVTAAPAGPLLGEKPLIFGSPNVTVSVLLAGRRMGAEAVSV